jgi:aminodeoxyfutalosine synthase
MDSLSPSAARLLPPDLRPVYDKVAAGIRLSEADALFLFQHQDLNALGTLANIPRERKNGNVATYIRNLYVNYSNHCILSCQFCAFSARKRDPHAFEFTIEEIVNKVKSGLAHGITEVHMVGGLHPTLPASWYIELLQALRALDPHLFLKAFTAIEIRHLADRIFKKPLQETLALLKEAGLGALTGGGAEIFDQGVRDRICRGKETAQEWLEVHEAWHGMGMRSTATMLFGHVETLEQRVEHLRLLRGLQDRTAGFTAFIPFAFVPETTALAHIPPTTAADELRTLAVSRLYLDNFDHITAYWISFGLPLAALALNYGVDDLHGTIMEEKIFHMAGAKTPLAQSQLAFEKAIREAGREPVPRDTWYRRLSPAASPEAGVQTRSGAAAST